MGHNGTVANHQRKCARTPPMLRRRAFGRRLVTQSAAASRPSAFA